MKSNFPVGTKVIIENNSSGGGYDQYYGTCGTITEIRDTYYRIWMDKDIDTAKLQGKDPHGVYHWAVFKVDCIPLMNTNRQVIYFLKR